jgi:ribosomal protein S18 acetylase RimI-like enzyme
MHVREATAADAAAIRRVARESLAASYGDVLAESALTSAVERWYGEESLSEQLAADDGVYLVAVDDGEVVGVAQSYVVPGRETAGELDWLHVVPDRRGAGVGTQLLTRLESLLLERGADRIEGRVLAANAAGTDFYERHGFSLTGTRPVDVGGETFTERLYVRVPGDGDEAALTEEWTAPNGETLYVAYDESSRGSVGPFYVAYRDRERTDRYGPFCGNCGSVSTAMDPMERIECNDCGNRRKATRWDAAYL